MQQTLCYVKHWGYFEEHKTKLVLAYEADLEKFSTSWARQQYENIPCKLHSFSEYLSSNKMHQALCEILRVTAPTWMDLKNRTPINGSRLQDAATGLTPTAPLV